ncbi:MAG: Fibronectin type domain protein [Modestobacter sp.]|jgi:hypothetical protein|nr:Fibronectin type domain protein [Modestobacter sp.]
MTRTRSTTAGGRGDGRGATAPSASRLPRSGRRVGAALLAGALTTTGVVVALGGVAQAENPPLGPGNIEIFTQRDMVALEGYRDQAGERATVTVKRGGQVIGIGEGTIDATGFLEFNHPGGECWIGVTPNIRGGDLVEVSFSESAFVDGATVGSAVITSVDGSTVTATPQDGDVEGTVTIRGTYGADVDLSRFVVEVVNPEMRRPDPGAPPTSIGERAIGWTPLVDPAAPNGGPGFTVDGTAADGRFEVVFGLQSAADQQRVLDGTHVALSWLADGVPDLALGATQFEFGESDGPGFGGCPAGPGTQPPLPPKSAQLTAGTDSVTVTWTTPTQAPDVPAVTQYRVAAVDGVLGQEVAVRTGSTTATLQSLAARSYEITMEAFNGQGWSPVQPLGTVDLATGTVTPGPGGTGGTGGTTGTTGTTGTVDPATEQPATIPAAPAGVTATATGLATMDVSWTASAGATSYVVSLSSSAAGAAVPAPVTVTAPTTTASIAGLTPGTTYTVSVTAGNTAGASTTGTASATTAATVAPGAARVTRVLSAHEGVTLEWQAASAGNAFSPVTGYDLVATPTTGTNRTPVTVSVGAVTNGTVAGLRNGTTYDLAVFAKAEALRGAAAAFGNGVPTTVVPNDQVAVTRADYRTDKREYRIQGTAQDTTQNTVTVRTSAGTLIAANIPVSATGIWSVSLRNAPALPTDNRIRVTSTSGGNVLTAVTRSR